MRWPNLRSLFAFSGEQAVPVPPAPRSHVAPQAVSAAASRESAGWPPQRLTVTDALWGEGFQFPGGELEVLRLARPLGLSAASSLLLVGAGSGGPACSCASHLGVWVTGFEADALLADVANERSIRMGLGRRAQIETWDPHAPEFGRGYFHHGLALDPLRGGNHELVLAAIATALKPAGQLTLLQTVADEPLDSEDRHIAAWARLDRRDLADLPSQAGITRMLGRLGFEVRIVEDVSHRHMQQALFGWKQVVGGLEQIKPTVRQAGPLVQEAELWMLQLRLFRAQKLRRVRWHAIGHGG
jgi:cyclopropane fatty-acyl-phospholipid synthase-like methyltransferase